MKKLFAAILLLAVTIAAAAQTYSSRQGYALPDNEISVYYGQGSYTQLAMALGGALHRYVHRSIAVGAVLGYEGGTMSFSTPSGTEDSGRFSFIEFMPSATFKWFSLPSLSMYSRVTVGAMLGLSDGDTAAAFAFHASPVGIDFGTGMFRGFLEAGFGCQGILTAGLKLCL